MKQTALLQAQRISTVPLMRLAPTRFFALQRKCVDGGAPVVGGESAECREKQSAPKTNLIVNEPGDSLEQEADRIAELAMSGRTMPAPASVLPMGAASIQPGGSLLMGQAPNEREMPSGGGQALDSSTRSLMESRFGYDFSQVRVHADGKAAESARKVNAAAYTLGRDVVFGLGQYRPGTSEGYRLLAHELAHVVQQTSRVKQSSRMLQRKAAASVATKVIAHGASSDALKMAQRRMNQVLGSLKDPSAGELKATTVELHIIPHDKKLTDLPEFASLKGTKTFDGRTYDELRGVGATKVGDTIRYAIAEEQLVAVKGQPSGYALGFVAAHESGHVVEQFGLSKEQKKALQEAYTARKAAKGPWLSPAWYTSSGTGEYFAQSTSAYFGRPYSSSEADKKTYTRDWLTKNDPGMHKLLASVYT